MKLLRGRCLCLPERVSRALLLKCGVALALNAWLVFLPRSQAPTLANYMLLADCICCRICCWALHSSASMAVCGEQHDCMLGFLC